MHRVLKAIINFLAGRVIFFASLLLNFFFSESASYENVSGITIWLNLKHFVRYLILLAIENIFFIVGAKKMHD